MNAKSFDGPLRYEHFVCVLIQFHRQAENSITLGRGGVLGTVGGGGLGELERRYMELINSTGVNCNLYCDTLLVACRIELNGKITHLASCWFGAVACSVVLN